MFPSFFVLPCKQLTIVGSVDCMSTLLITDVPVHARTTLHFNYAFHGEGIEMVLGDEKKKLS